MRAQNKTCIYLLIILTASC